MGWPVRRRISPVRGGVDAASGWHGSRTHHRVTETSLAERRFNRSACHPKTTFQEYRHAVEANNRNHGEKLRGETPWSARNVQDSNLRNLAVQPLSRRPRSTTPTTFQNGGSGGRIEREKRPDPPRAPDGTWTHNHPIRSRKLYPIELQEQRTGVARPRGLRGVASIERRKHATTDDRTTPYWPCFARGLPSHRMYSDALPYRLMPTACLRRDSNP